MHRIKWIGFWLLFLAFNVQAALPGSVVGYVSDGRAFSNQPPQAVVYNDGYQEQLIVFYKDPYTKQIHYTYARNADNRGLLEWVNARMIPTHALHTANGIHAKVLGNALYLFGRTEQTAFNYRLIYNYVQSFNELLNESWGNFGNLTSHYYNDTVGIALHQTHRDGIKRLYINTQKQTDWKTLTQTAYNINTNPLSQDLPTTTIKPDKNGNQPYPFSLYDYDYNNQHHMIYAQMYKKSGKADGIKFHKLDEGADTFLYRLNGKSGKPKIETNEKPVSLLKVGDALYLYYLDKDNALMMTQTALSRFYPGNGWFEPRAVLTLSNENPIGISTVHYNGRNYIFYTNRDSGELRYTVEPVG